MSPPQQSKYPRLAGRLHRSRERHRRTLIKLHQAHVDGDIIEAVETALEATDEALRLARGEDDGLRTDGGKYVVERGDGYVANYNVYDAGDGCRCTIRAAAIRAVPAEEGDQMALIHAPDGVVLVPIGEVNGADVLASPRVGADLNLQIAGDVLRAAGIDGDADRCCVYERDGPGVLLVSADDDPRVGGGP